MKVSKKTEDVVTEFYEAVGTPITLTPTHVAFYILYYYDGFGWSDGQPDYKKNADTPNMDHKISMLKRTMGLCEQAKLDVSFYISQLEAMKSAYAKFQGPMDICPNLAADLSFQMCERRAAPEDAHQDWKTMDAMFKDHFRAQQAYRP